MSENEEQTSPKENSNSKVYEVGYLLAPTIKEEDVGVNYGNLKVRVSSFG